jgi:hypothetical protein
MVTKKYVRKKSPHHKNFFSHKNVFSKSIFDFSFLDIFKIKLSKKKVDVIVNKGFYKSFKSVFLVFILYFIKRIYIVRMLTFKSVFLDFILIFKKEYTLNSMIVFLDFILKI